MNSATLEPITFAMMLASGLITTSDFSNIIGLDPLLKVSIVRGSMGRNNAGCSSQGIMRFEPKYVVVDSEPWFKGKVVANA
jgi:hypothetical protein